MKNKAPKKLTPAQARKNANSRWNKVREARIEKLATKLEPHFTKLTTEFKGHELAKLIVGAVLSQIKKK
jgi:hypothetical protein